MGERAQQSRAPLIAAAVYSAACLLAWLGGWAMLSTTDLAMLPYVVLALPWGLVVPTLLDGVLDFWSIHVAIAAGVIVNAIALHLVVRRSPDAARWISARFEDEIDEE